MRKITKNSEKIENHEKSDLISSHLSKKVEILKGLGSLCHPKCAFSTSVRIKIIIFSSFPFFFEFFAIFPVLQIYFCITIFLQFPPDNSVHFADFF